MKAGPFQYFPLVFDGLGRVDLLPGCYLVTYNEVVNLPKNIMALAMPRSSLLRCGVSIHNAVWDAGYSGRSQSLLVVYNPQGFRLHRNARIVQMVFFLLSREVAQGYQGCFKARTSNKDFKLGLIFFNQSLSCSSPRYSNRGYTYFPGDLAVMESLNSKHHG